MLASFTCFLDNLLGSWGLGFRVLVSNRLLRALPKDLGIKNRIMHPHMPRLCLYCSPAKNTTPKHLSNRYLQIEYHHIIGPCSVSGKRINEHPASN